MSQFAPVVPLACAKILQGANVQEDHLGMYHLLLAHDILEHPKEYVHIYSEVRRRYRRESFIIMDNSIIELGHPLKIKDLIAAAAIIQPDCIVIPDAMGDGADTRGLAAHFCREYAKAIYAMPEDEANIMPPLLGVIQGRDVPDCMETASLFYVSALVEYVSVPRIIGQQMGSRMPVLTELTKSPQFKGIHLLGFSDNILDDVCCARHPGVMGIDSAVPIRAAIRGHNLTIEQQLDYGKRGNFWELPPSTFQDNKDLIVENLLRIRDWIEV